MKGNEVEMKKRKETREGRLKRAGEWGGVGVDGPRVRRAKWSC